MNRTEEFDIPEIDIQLESKTIVAKTIKLKSWHFLTKNGCIIFVKSKLLYWIYKILWKIKPPKIDLDSYHNSDIEG